MSTLGTLDFAGNEVGAVNPILSVLAGN